MNKNRKLSNKADQKRVRSGVNVNENFKIVEYPTHEKHVQPHLEKDYATKTRKRRDKMMARDRYIAKM